MLSQFLVVLHVDGDNDDLDNGYMNVTHDLEDETLNISLRKEAQPDREICVYLTGYKEVDALRRHCEMMLAHIDRQERK